MFARHGTLTGNTVEVVTVTGLPRAVSYITVSLPAGSGEAWFTVATNGATAATPTVGGNDTYRLATAHPAWSVPVGTTSSVQVRILSTAALPYSVHGE